MCRPDQQGSLPNNTGGNGSGTAGPDEDPDVLVVRNGAVVRGMAEIRRLVDELRRSVAALGDFGAVEPAENGDGTVTRPPPSDAQNELMLRSAHILYDLSEPPALLSALRSGAVPIVVRAITSTATFASSVDVEQQERKVPPVRVLLESCLYFFLPLTRFLNHGISAEIYREVIKCLLHDVLAKSFPSRDDTHGEAEIEEAETHRKVIVALMRSTCGCCLEDDIAEANRKLVIAEGGIRSIVELMQRNPSDLHVQDCSLSTLENIVSIGSSDDDEAEAEAEGETMIGIRVQLREVEALRVVAEAIDNAITQHEVTAGGSQAVVVSAIKLMGKIFPYPSTVNIRGEDYGADDDEFVSEASRCSNFVSRITRALLFEGFVQDEEVQDTGLNTLSNISIWASGRKTLTTMPIGGGAHPMIVDVVTAAMRNHPTSANIQMNAMLIILSFARNRTCSCLPALASSGALELICLAVENHFDTYVTPTAVLTLAASSKWGRDCASIMSILLTSTVPYILNSIVSAYIGYCNSNPLDTPSSTPMMVKDASMALSNMGLAIDGSRFCAENQLDTPIECGPPFDVGSILDKELLSDAPGWFKAFPFQTKCNGKITALEEEENYLGAQEIAPEVGQKVALWVMLPFGGRGYLHGKVIGVSSITTSSRTLPSPDSTPSFEKENTTTIVPGYDPIATADSKLLIPKTDKSLCDREVQAIVSLDSSFGGKANASGDDKKKRGLGGAKETEKTLPLPAFFRGETTRYVVKLRFQVTDTMRWVVVKISEAP